QTGDSFEKLDKQLEALTGSSEKAQQASAWIKDFTQETPLQLEQVTEQFTKLKAFGLDPMDGTLQNLVDANERLGGGMERLNGVVTAFGQAWAKQKLQGEEIMQLVEKGIPVWETLEKVTGKNTAELQKLSSAGKLGRDVIKQLMEELGNQASGAALANMTTLSGYISNLKDQWQSFLNEIANAGALDYAKERLSSLLETIKELDRNGTLKSWAKSISDAMVNISKGVQVTIETLVKFKTEILSIATILTAGAFYRGLGNAMVGLGKFGAAAKIAGGAAKVSAGNMGILAASMRALPATIAITVAVTGIKAAISGFDTLFSKMSGYEESQRQLMQINDQFKNNMFDLAAGFREQAEALGTVRDMEYQSTEALLQMSKQERDAYELKLSNIKEYLRLKVSESQATKAAGADLDDETKRALELYKTHTAGMMSLKEANDFVAKAIKNNLSIAAQQAVDSFAELQANGMSAADAFKTAGESLDLKNLDDVRTLNALLKEIENSGSEMSQELSKALGDITGDINFSDLDRIRTTIDAAFTNAEDKARALGAVLKTGLADELSRLGLSFSELETGIDASASQAVTDFQAVIEVIKSTGVEAEIAEQKIIEAYQAAKNQAGDSTVAVDQLNDELKRSGDEGLVSQKKVQTAIKETGNEATNSGQQINTANQNAKKGFKEVAQAAEEVTEAMKKQADAGAALAKVVGDFINATVSELKGLSDQTANLFNERVGFDTTPILNDTEQLKAAMQQAQRAAIETRQGIASIGVDATGLNSFRQQLTIASNEASAAFYKQKLSYQELMNEIDSGDLSGNALVRAAQDAVNTFDLLDSKDLSNLENAIVSARREMESLSDSASDTLGNLQDELDRLKGNYDEIEQREYDQKKSELEALIKQAEAAGNSAAVTDYRESLDVLKEINRERERQRTEERKAAQETKETEKSTAPEPSQTKESPTKSSSVNLRLPGGGTSTVSGNPEDIDALLDYLAEAQMSTTE
ncbi:MAG: tape measure domain-containing protein, partial [Reinekea sp.]